MKIVYIGHKDQKGDNLAGTGLVWTRGEVHEVADEKKAAKLIEHKLVWANADGKSPEEITAMLLPELQSIMSNPTVRFTSKEPEFTHWEPYVLPVPGHILKGLQDKSLEAVFMSPEDADKYAEWLKLERDTAPTKTGPKPQAKETRPGLQAKSA